MNHRVEAQRAGVVAWFEVVAQQAVLAVPVGPCGRSQSGWDGQAGCAVGDAVLAGQGALVDGERAALTDALPRVSARQEASSPQSQATGSWSQRSGA